MIYLMPRGGGRGLWGRVKEKAIPNIEWIAPPCTVHERSEYVIFSLFN